MRFLTLITVTFVLCEYLVVATPTLLARDININTNKILLNKAPYVYFS